MIYHYATWTSDELSARSFLGRMGIYRAAIFYVLILSGVCVITVSIIATLCISHFVYKYFETYFTYTGHKKQSFAN